MFTTTTYSLPRSVAALVAALALSATCIGAAVAPAGAAAPAPTTLADWQSAVAEQIANSADRFSDTREQGVSRRAVVAVTLDADGRFAGAALDRTSGSWTFDRDALRTVAHFRYPALPASFRGRPTTVKVNLVLGSPSDMDGYAKLLAESQREGTQLAHRTAPTRMAAK